jgi:hypothetical protein
MTVSAKRALDFACAGLILYSSLWIYELSNYVAYLMAGLGPSLILNGPFPSGVASVVGGGQDIVLLKPVQTIISCAGVGILYVIARKSGATTSAASAITSMSVFAASLYWELLPVVGFLSYYLHFAIFMGLVTCIEFGLIRRARLPIWPD